MRAKANQAKKGQGCDQVPTGVATEHYWLRFRVPPGLMPDRQFDGRPAKLQVHRVRPVYANGKCPSVPTQAVVLIHGRTVTGPVAFDLRAPAPGGDVLSVQEALARAGIDTFAPSLLGYGKSTRFDESLNDPGNASLRGYPTDAATGAVLACPHPEEGCDRTLIPGINPLDQQGNQQGTTPVGLWIHPLAKQRRAHSSKFRFARTDVWVRDIDQVIADAIKRAQPDDDKVTLVGYSVGGQHVGRTLYADNPNKLLDERDQVIEKVSRVVFLNSLFGGPTEDPDPFGRPTFPLTLNDRSGSDALWQMSTAAACPGRIIPGTQKQVWEQTMEHETVGREWGGDDANQPPIGLNRAPTFSGYGWNPVVAGQLSTPTLVMQGLEDGVLPTGKGTGQAIYNALPASPWPMASKVLVQVECASHALLWEGCAGNRCKPASGTTSYGGKPGDPWAGPHATLKAALIEWIKSGTFNGAANGSFKVNESGVARPAP